jgi:hypothetical protein
MNAAFQHIRSAVAPSAVSPVTTRDFPWLVCQWNRDIEGRLSCVWTRIPDRPQSG